MAATNTAQQLPIERDWWDIETTPEDFDAVGPGVWPERLIVDLPGHGPVNVLAAQDLNTWAITSVHSIDTGLLVELSRREEWLIKNELTDRRREELSGD